MIIKFRAMADFADGSTLALDPTAPMHGDALGILSVVDLAVLSVLLKETTAIVDRALAVAKSQRAGAEAEQRLRDRGIIQ